MSNNDTINVLILDDQETYRNGLGIFINKIPGLQTQLASKPSEAYEITKNQHIDIAILDIDLPQESGIEVMKKIKQVNSETEVIIISGHSDIETVVECLRQGAFDYFKKPFDMFAIKNAIEKTKKFIEIKDKLSSAKERIRNLENIVQNQQNNLLYGSSKEINRVRDLIINVSHSNDTAVFISGETGTGKELVAKQIHALSNRNMQVLSVYNCSAIPEHLFESEFFGYSKGAFTDAKIDKKGWFEIADKGTLFLDEIGDMPMFLQSKLLRILEEKKVTRLGAVKAIDIDVRVISATNKNISDLIREGKFREDLYYRLNTFEIELPPLKNRKEDIAELSYLFLKEFAAKLNKKINHIDEVAISQLLSFKYPGNVRQLKNFIERAVILCKGDTINKEHLINNIFDFSTNQNTTTTPTDNNLDLAKNELQLIERALKLADNNKTNAAKLLNITVQSLIRRMQKYKL
ncbi:MAG: sigma-54-dependent Fis family transcriptional regulator [Bacteroidetes bacterium]|nr:sigma-54-dependent Fis family transcriptional regulator [Bacteroidota bacterium]